MILLFVDCHLCLIWVDNTVNIPELGNAKCTISSALPFVLGNAKGTISSGQVVHKRT